MSKPIESAIVIGAGMAGLAAARTLQASGVQVTVYDKGKGVGGRCATRRWDDSTFDHGAQYFTARDEAFHKMVNDALDAGVVVEWCRGFLKETGMPRDDDRPRYRGEPGMTAFPKWLANGLEVKTGHQATRVARKDGGVAVEFESGETAGADALVLTAPVPQSLALLDAGGVEVAGEDREKLDAIEYAPCLALMVRLNAAPMVPEPGAMQPREGGPLAWIADNERKGISRNPCLTVHAAPDFSQKHFDTSDDEVQSMLIEAVEHALGCQVVDSQLHRWRYALAHATADENSLRLSGPAPIVLAGDGFGGPRVEGAYLSGLAAAQSLLES